jgi:hypothetical protein
LARSGELPATQEASPEKKARVAIRPAPRNSISAMGRSPVEVGRVSQEEGATIMIYDRGEAQQRVIVPEIESDREADPEHWRQRIATYQEIIESSQRTDELENAYSMLAQSWYQLALITGARSDLLRAVEVQRAALDFATQKEARRRFRDRIEALEERLAKKKRE